ncbi:hypothetical protein [Psychrobacillus sp. L3]|uniref:hypothetical protein n=1 Tax=Psychrobacillus sp. L3 TaxID=3236891 RepID=UPI0036F2F3A2
MKRRLITIFITLLVLLGLSFGITYFTHTKFFDYSFFIGIAVTVCIWFSTSKGGFGSRRLHMSIQGSTGIRMENEKFKFSPNIALYTSLAYTIIIIAATICHYRSYF